jgi:hypothetical protein
MGEEDDEYFAILCNSLHLLFAVGMILKLCSEELGNSAEIGQGLCKSFVV